MALPIYKADSMVNIYACMATTSTSITLTKTEKNIDPGGTQTLSEINIKETRLYIIMCPAVIFANKRIINEAGLIKTPANSIRAKKGFKGTGTPGIQKICFQ